ncbi:DNA/RNA non-specific endonuclease [Acaryochloris sp. 'Moss Beach']|uniref:DNA/RNA non-specific endonuclease n=1 Tax=Acaryochloris sp. 'Moss Beach' TaxID=2740837 RepID=UPI0037BF7590|nr:DNA/RNA non-specific endonuclease [Acaryochloris sp. 'Moss Beach']
MRSHLPITVFLCFSLLTGCSFFSIFTQSNVDHLALGNPSQARVVLADSNNYLMKKPQFALSYNRSKGIPNWVSWQLDQTWLGDVERRNDFRADQSLPPKWEKVDARDYTRSGYDRGHMTPSGDRTNSEVNNSATFVMTNIVPQRPDNNRGPWVDLENYCRDLVDDGKELFIIAGGYGKRAAIAKGKVIPPQNLWKIIVVMDETTLGINGISANTPVIAVDIPNKQGIKSHEWQRYIVTVDHLEQETGYDFLPNIPESIQTRLESQKATLNS